MIDDDAIAQAGAAEQSITKPRSVRANTLQCSAVNRVYVTTARACVIRLRHDV